MLVMQATLARVPGLRDHPRTQTIPVVAVTARAMPAEVVAGKAAGFADYLTKPFEVAHLVHVVTQLIARGLRDAARQQG